MDRTARHDPERSAQGIRRARHLDFPSRGLLPHLDRAHQLRGRARAQLEPDQLLRLSLHGERRRPGRGNRLHLRQRADDPRRAAPAPRRARPSSRRCGASRSSSTAASSWCPRFARCARTSSCGASCAATNTASTDVAFRAGCQVRSLTLTERQPELNIIRIAYEALPVVISADARVNALQLPGFREAMALPDQAEQALSLRTQQILMHETGLAECGDIFEGSKVVEKLTGEIAERARAIAMRLRDAGYSRAIAAVGGELTRLLAERQRKLASGELVQVGVNAFLDEIGLHRRQRRDRRRRGACGGRARTDRVARPMAPRARRQWRRRGRPRARGAGARGRKRRRRDGADDRSRARRRHGRRMDRRDRARDQRPLHAARARSHDGARAAQRASALRGASVSRSARPGSTAISTRSSCSRTPACRPGWK